MKFLVSLLCQRTLTHLPLSLSVSLLSLCHLNRSCFYVYVVNVGGIYILGLTASLFFFWLGEGYLYSVDLEIPECKRLGSRAPNLTFGCSSIASNLKLTQSIVIVCLHVYHIQAFYPE